MSPYQYPNDPERERASRTVASSPYDHAPTEEELAADTFAEECMIEAQNKILASGSEYENCDADILYWSLLL